MNQHILHFILLVTVISSPAKADQIVLTDEWQTVPEGHSVPEGGHYRMNMQTGKVEAKLAENVPNINNQMAIVNTPKDDEDEKELHPSAEDINQITTLVKTFRENEAKRSDIIEDLDMILRKLETANFFVKQPFIDELMGLITDSSTKEPLLKGILRLFTAMSQGNRRVKARLLEKNFISILMRVPIANSSIAKSVFTCLGTQLRNNDTAQKKFFIEMNGVQFLEQSHQSIQESMKGKIYSILSDTIGSVDTSTDLKTELVKRINSSTICQSVAKDFEAQSHDISSKGGLVNNLEFITQASYLLETCVEQSLLDKETMILMKKNAKSVEELILKLNNPDWDMKEEKNRLGSISTKLRVHLPDEL